MTASFTRAQLLGRSARGGAALLVAGTALGQLTEAAAADPLPGLDLAYARLLIGAELLAADFYAQAIAASNAGKHVAKYLKRAHLNEQKHYESVSEILSGAGATPAVPNDINFTYPAGTFATEGSIVKFARDLESTILGAYLGAIGGIQTNAFKVGLAQIAACEAQHSAFFTNLAGGNAFLSFPPVLTIEEASNALDAFTA